MPQTQACECTCQAIGRVGEKETNGSQIRQSPSHRDLLFRAWTLRTYHWTSPLWKRECI